jgi:hypothetical protein
MMDCAACRTPLTSLNRAGEVSVSLTLKPGGKIGVSLPICLTCNDTAALSPESGLSVLRLAVPRALKVR